MNTKKYDYLIIGAGIMGLTVAKALSEQFPLAKIAIIEKEATIGVHASGRNSGVLHSGIYYPEESLKAQVCAAGAKKMLDFAKEHQIAFEATGKVIIPTSSSELTTMDFLLNNALSNGINAARLEAKEIKKIEPHSNPYQYGLYVPSTAIIDSKQVLEKLQTIITSRGVKLYTGSRLVAVDPKRCLVSTSSGQFQYGYLFNCAGAGTLKIAKMLGLGADYNLLPFKGIYYKLSEKMKHLVNGNIYPVPNLAAPFLGVHFTRTIGGEVYVGPTAIPAFGPENYGLVQGVGLESFRIIKDISRMYYANHQNFRYLIHTEMKKYIKRNFIANAQQLVPAVSIEDLQASGKVGIRAQLINSKKRTIVMDYVIEQNANSMHVLNAISPAFTSSFCFAELLIQRMQMGESCNARN